MLFEQKKIRIETLSEYLTSARNNLKLTTTEASKKTGIKPKFLLSLENGDFQALPADVYVLGFLNQLAQLYAVDANELVVQYKKERSIQKQVFRQSSPQANVWYRKYYGRIVITPKILSLILGLIFVVSTLSYIVWQLWSIDNTPSLRVSQPQENAVISGAFVDVSGQTDPGMDVSVNGQNIFVDSQGNFQTQAGLAPGPAEITIVAANRFGKSASKILNLTGAGSASSTGSIAGSLELGISFSGPVVLGFAIDDQPAQSLSFNTGDHKTFTASQKILISTTDAGATKISLNGQNLGAMGRPKEQLANIPFFAQPDSASSSQQTGQ